MRAELRPTTQASDYSTFQAAARLGVSVGTVQHWVERGLLTAWKTPGGHRRIDAKAIEAFEERKRRDRKKKTGLCRILLISSDEEITDALMSAAEAGKLQAEIHRESSTLHGLVSVGHWCPELVIIDADTVDRLLIETSKALLEQRHCTQPDICILGGKQRESLSAQMLVQGLKLPVIAKPIDLGLVASLATRAVSNPFCRENVTRGNSR